MTKSENKVLETEVVIFPVKCVEENTTNNTVNETENEISDGEKQADRAAALNDRFSRLKKSLRKKSVSIL